MSGMVSRIQHMPGPVIEATHAPTGSAGPSAVHLPTPGHSSISAGLSTGKSHPTSFAPTSPMVVQAGTGKSIDRMMSVSTSAFSGGQPLAVQAGASGKTGGSVAWASGA